MKFCGLTQTTDINEILKYQQVNALGFITYKKSPRYISQESLTSLLAPLKKTTLLKVGVFVNSSIEEILSYIDAGINTIQLHGNETNHFIQELKEQVPKIPIWKVFRLKTHNDINNIKNYPLQTILIDSFSTNEYGGTGKIADWSLVKKVAEKYPKKNIILAGGINSKNIKEIQKLFPHIYGIDLSSSIEEDNPRKKSSKKIREFLKEYSIYFP